MKTISPLAQDYVALYESPDPQRLFAYSPGIARLDSGRLAATLDLGGPGAADLPKPKYEHGEADWSWQGKVYTSDDGGASWTHRADFPFLHARPFAAGKALYVLGEAADLTIIRSDDDGETWSDPVKLSENQAWHQAPCNVHYANGCVYLVMERRVTCDIRAWHVGEIAPVLMRGRIGDDLTRREKWTFASELSFRDILANIEDDPQIDFIGVPFFTAPYPGGGNPSPGRNCAPIGWLESHVVQFVDPDHRWCDPTGKTFHRIRDFRALEY